MVWIILRIGPCFCWVSTYVFEIIGGPKGKVFSSRLCEQTTSWFVISLACLFLNFYYRPTITSTVQWTFLHMFSILHWFVYKYFTVRLSLCLNARYDWITQWFGFHAHRKNTTTKCNGNKNTNATGLQFIVLVQVPAYEIVEILQRATSVVLAQLFAISVNVNGRESVHILFPT